MRVSKQNILLQLNQRMYERSLHQILQVLRRIRCLSYAIVLITCSTLALYLLHDVLRLSPNVSTSFPMRYTSNDGFGATIAIKYVHECTPQSNIAFVKTHKTGSSTISNILLRYGERHNLTHLLYKYRSSTEYNSLKEERLIRNTLTPNIFAQHAQFNPEFLRNHLKDNLRFFTIIREPVSQFLSAFSFFEKTKIYPADTFDDSVTQFLNLHQTYLTTSRFCKDCNKVANANGVDMGFDIGEYMLADNKDQFVRNFLDRTDSLFEFVLITEYFDLSLVLLKRRFCLTFEDILYLRSLERIKKESVEDSTKLRIKEFQQVDVAIYDYFNRTFWQQIDQEEGIFEELRQFQSINKAVQRYCIKGSTVGYKDTLENVLTDEARHNFLCLAMNTRCLPFSTLMQARDDEQVTEEQIDELKATPDDLNQDSLNLEQLKHLNRRSRLISLALDKDRERL